MTKNNTTEDTTTEKNWSPVRKTDSKQDLLERIDLNDMAVRTDVRAGLSSADPKSGPGKSESGPVQID